MNSNITVTSNRFNFPDVTLVTSEDGINYFNNTWTHIKTFNKQQELTGSGSIEIITKSTSSYATRKSTSSYATRKSTSNYATRKSTSNYATRKSTSNYATRKSTKKTAQWLLYHFTGTITKNLTDNISMYICTIYAGYNATTLIPANTYNTDDCIDIMILTRPDTNIMTMDITASDNNSQKIDSTFIVNINVDQYCL